MASKQALLIMDAQVNMFAEEFSIVRADEIVKILSDLVARATRRETAVIYIRNNGDPGEPDEAGTAGWEIHPALLLKSPGIVIDKRGPDAFSGTDLEKVLAEKGIHQLVIAGMQTEMCVETSVRRAVELGYEVILVSDGHSTFDFEDQSAVEEIKRVNAEIGALAKVERAEKIEFG